MKRLSRTPLLVGALVVAAHAASSGGSLDVLLDIHGDGYRGAIVPAHRLPRWLGSPTEAWTPTLEEARRADEGLRAYLAWGVAHRERFEPAEDSYVREELPYVVNGLPRFTRYYLGRFVDPAMEQDDVSGRHLLVIGVAGSYTRYGHRDMWLAAVPHVIDGACSNWFFYWEPIAEQPVKFTCNGNP